MARLRTIHIIEKTKPINITLRLKNPIKTNIDGVILITKYHVFKGTESELQTIINSNQYIFSWWKAFTEYGFSGEFIQSNIKHWLNTTNVNWRKTVNNQIDLETLALYQDLPSSFFITNKELFKTNINNCVYENTTITFDMIMCFDEQFKDDLEIKEIIRKQCKQYTDEQIVELQLKGYI